MPSKDTTVDAYINELPADRKEAITALRKVIKKNLPKGFTEQMSYGMIGYVVPHKLYPAGYHCDASQPLPFMSLASQKNFIALYHMMLYSDAGLKGWFEAEYAKLGLGKLDMGKSCIRFKKLDKIPYLLIGELAGKITPQQWMEQYEKTLKR
ncbi:MAG TPA: DUF1801 domain-containing protein [Ferruginibacter sp.]|nr:DUF1801 domain-containing protein [Ferruginibacter sp.]HMP19774.1 DUF1801 domain-containing protein [Ferruginibacter sp.]